MLSYKNRLIVSLGLLMLKRGVKLSVVEADAKHLRREKVEHIRERYQSELKRRLIR